MFIADIVQANKYSVTELLSLKPIPTFVDPSKRLPVDYTQFVIRYRHTMRYKHLSIADFSECLKAMFYCEPQAPQRIITLQPSKCTVHTCGPPALYQLPEYCTWRYAPNSPIVPDHEALSLTWCDQYDHVPSTTTTPAPPEPSPFSLDLFGFKYLATIATSIAIIAVICLMYKIGLPEAIRHCFMNCCIVIDSPSSSPTRSPCRPCPPTPAPPQFSWEDQQFNQHLMIAQQPTRQAPRLNTNVIVNRPYNAPYCQIRHSHGQPTEEHAV